MKKQGYPAYKTKDGKKKTIHSRVGEKKYFYDKPPPGFVIHHIDENKDNAQRYNLIAIHRKDHKRIHQRKTLIIKSVQPSKSKCERCEIDVNEENTGLTGFHKDKPEKILYYCCNCIDKLSKKD